MSYKITAINSVGGTLDTTVVKEQHEIPNAICRLVASVNIFDDGDSIVVEELEEDDGDDDEGLEGDRYPLT